MQPANNLTSRTYDIDTGQEMMLDIEEGGLGGIDPKLVQRSFRGPMK